ncbi:MAG TPA: DUF2182 domain-containing protein [Caulobacteraceae bacterium]|jgi:hypothetical protein|nr:DUF2182 domain-containing protein [Caulobacteraceae bacterium]
MKGALYAVSAMARGRFWPLLAISGACWVALAAVIADSPLVRICGGAVRWEALLGDGRWRILQPQLVFDALMLGAMMTPLLAHNLACVLRQSLRARKWRAVALFLLGYTAPWMGALFGLWALAGWLVRLLRSDLAALALVLGFGLMWQGTRTKARALRACHRGPTLPTFGARAELGSFTYGLTSAGWCIAACWLWMLAPFTWAAGHLWLMLGAFGLMLTDRYGRPPQLRRRQAWIGTGAAVAIGAGFVAYVGR